MTAEQACRRFDIVGLRIAGLDLEGISGYRQECPRGVTDLAHSRRYFLL